MTEQPCVLAHHTDPDRPRRALDGLYVCAGHQAGLQRWLRQLPPLHAALDLAVATGDRAGGPVVSGTRDVGVDLNDRVTTVRKAIRHKLASWALMVNEEHPSKPTLPNLSAEALPPVRLVPRRRKYNLIDPKTGAVSTITTSTAIPHETTEVGVLAGWLSTWHDWLLAQDYVDDWAQDVGDLHSEAWSCAYPSGRKWHVIANCPAGECDGQLRATLGAHDDLLPDRVICTDDPEHTWAADQWRALRRSLPGREEWLSVAALSQVHGVAHRTMARWATEGGCRRREAPRPWPTPGRPPVLYHADEIEAAVLARRAAFDIP